MQIGTNNFLTMITRAIVVCCFSTFFIVINVDAFVRRDVSSDTSPPHLVTAFHENINQVRQCIDQSLARTVGEVNEKQLQPLFSATNDLLTRLFKAFDDLTAPRSTQDIPSVE